MMLLHVCYKQRAHSATRIMTNGHPEVHVLLANTMYKIDFK